MLLILVLGFILVFLAVHWALERQRLRRFLRGIGALPRDPRQLALELAATLAARPQAHDDRPFLAAFLAPLGASPGTLLKHGGCCSGISRLYILCLAELGIRAHQITLYHQDGRAAHCLVEALLGDGPLIADPVYGLHYQDSTGAPVGLEALQAGADVVLAPLPRHGRRSYPAGSYYQFDFSQTKTANWTKSSPRRLLYGILAPLTGGQVDRLRLPAMLEWPQVLLAVIVLVGAVVAELILALL